MQVVALCGVNHTTSNGTLVGVGCHQVRVRGQGTMWEVKEDQLRYVPTCRRQ